MRVPGAETKDPFCMALREHPARQLDEPTLSALASAPRRFLAADWSAASDDRTFGVDDPVTGTEIARVADCTVDDALRALAAAHEAGESWGRAPSRERADVLHRLFALMHRDRERLARLLVLEVGKTLGEARGEVDYAAEYVRWYAEEAVRVGGRSTLAPDGGSHIVTVTEPVGVCLLITPWNVPLAMATRKFAPALAAGCTAVLKPAELTPLATLALAELVIEAGAPAGVLTVITTSEPASVVERLMSDPRTRKISFTGSTEVGRILQGQTGPQVLRSSMELGGNAPFIVFDDADLDLAVQEATIAKLRLGGQSCVAANRFLVQSGIADRFAAAIGAVMSAVRVGDPLEEHTELGPLVEDRAVAKATRLVDDALAHGAQLIGRAEAPKGAGSYFAPTTLDFVPADAAITREEVFAPVVAISRFDTEEEAIARANDTEFGLAAYVITGDAERARRVSGRIAAGMIGVNRGLVSHVAAPFGGIKQSGLGREGGPEGIAEYQQLRYLSLRGLYV